MRPLCAGLLLTAILLTALLAAPAAGGASPPGDALEDALGGALAWLAEEISAGPVLVEALAGAGLDAAAWPRPGSGPLDRLAVPGADLPLLASVRAIHAVAASGHDPRAFPDDGGPRDLLAEVEARAAEAAATPTVADDAFGLLALVHGGAPQAAAVAAFVASLREAQRGDGGWSCIGPSSTDCTGFALAALAAAGAAPADREAALAFLDAMRTDDGGVASDPRHLATANTNSAAWALHAYAALGEAPPEGLWAWVMDRRTPEGGFAWKHAEDGPDVAATLELLPHLAGRPLPWPRFDPGGEAVVTTTAAQGDGQAIVRLRGGFTAVVWTDEEGRQYQGEGAVVPVAPGETRRLHVHGEGPGVHHRAILVLEGPSEGRGAPAAGAPAVLLVLLFLAVWGPARPGCRSGPPGGPR